MNAHRSFPKLPSNQFHWPQVWALLGLDLAILLSWMAYNEYQLRLLDRFGYGSHATAFLAVQVFIQVTTPPLAGYLADRLVARGVGRLVLVTLGVSLAAMLFMTTAVAIVHSDLSASFSLFPILVILWMLAMNLFHAPAMSLLESFAPLASLTSVASAFTVLGGLVAALEPAVVSLIDSVGAAPTFAGGGVLVLAAGLGFRWFANQLAMPIEKGDSAAPTHSAFALILVLGLVLGLAEAVMSDLMPVWVAGHGDLIPGIPSAWQSSILYAVAALAGWPLGRAGDRYSPQLLAVAGIQTGVVLGVLAWWLPAEWAKASLVLFPVAYAALAVASLPVAFSRLTSRHKAAGIGLLFSGIELADGLVKLALAL